MINLIERLPEEEIIAFRQYGAYMDGVCPDSLSDEKLFGPWNYAKQDLYKLLGNKFIINQNVEYTEGLEIIENKIRETVNGYHPVRKALSDLIQKHFYEKELYTTGDKLSVLNFNSTLALNTWDEDTLIISADANPTGKVIKIQKGMKIIKAIEKLLKVYDMFNAEEFENFRILHSQCLNTAKLKGNLHLSIHPLDYATMSDNNCGWESCMLWGEGEYHQGTIEMMNSRYMVVAYLTSSEPFRLPGNGDYTWTNKKWRKLYIVSPELLMGIRAYPYAAESLDFIVLDWLKQLAEQNMGWGYFPQRQKVDNHRDNTLVFDNLQYTMYLDLHMNHMYNDIGHNHYAYFTSDNMIYDKRSSFCMSLSGESECLVCGQTGYECIEHAYLECHSCGSFSQCPICGHWDHDDAEWYEYNGQYICQCCWEDLCECECCSQLKEYADCEYIYIHYLWKGYWDYQPKEYTYEFLLCRDCYDDLMKNCPVTNGRDYYLKDMTLEQFKELLKNIFSENSYWSRRNDLIEKWNFTHPDDEYIEEDE